MRRLVVAIVALAGSVVVAAAVVVTTVAPPSTTTEVANHVRWSVTAPAGLASGTTPDTGGTAWITTVTRRRATLERVAISSTSTRVLDRIVLHGPNDQTNDVTSAICAIAGGDTVAAAISTTDPSAPWHDALVVASARTGHLLGEVALDGGAVLDLNGRAGVAVFDVLTGGGSGARNVAVDVSGFSATPPTPSTVAADTRLPAATIGTVLSADGAKIFALQRSGHVAVVASATGRVLGTIAGDPGTTKIGSSTDAGTLYLLVVDRSGTSRVRTVDAATGAPLATVSAPWSTRWILPSVDGQGLVEFAGTATSGRIVTVDLPA